ncbi:LuxR C-terminal-related transcriptional regulator [Solimonas terrae]|uniref:AAA family ATPase n=1 Tax=Solimonas terrae TaxID=1396819 RepID=A0A6M2BMJ7_9GAMM|nr:AAA family ATPase [Solimonas terrae]
MRANVVEAKLYPGIGTGQPLARPKLDPPPELRRGEASVALICAPAGYGKSTVMARWHELLQHDGLQCAWLSVDEDDNDSTRFLRHLVAAFQGISPDIGHDLLAQLTVTRDSVKPLLESLAADLARIPERAVLFIDDLHLATHDEVLETVHWLINYSPRQYQYVLGCRLAPKLPLSGLRVRRKLLEIGATDLEFSADETAAFLSLRLGRHLADDEIRQLSGKTEGWAAALELVAAALQTQDEQQARELIARFTGTDRSVVDYLGEMVLAGLDGPLRRFVECVAQFERVDAGLAGCVSGEPDAAQRLAELQARNLFLVPLDRHGEWFRFHHLVGHFFREHYRRRAPDECRAVLIAGARWLFEHGEIEEAINGAIRGEAWPQATTWVAQSVDEIIYRKGYHQTLMHWMRELPEQWVDQLPEIRINYAFALAFHTRRGEVEAQLHRLAQIVERLQQADVPDQPAIDAIRSAMELQVAISVALHDEGIEARDRARDWLQRWPDAPAVQKGHIANVLGFGHKTAGDIEQGLAVIAQGRRWHEQAEGHYGLAWNVYIEALLHMKRGSYREARQVSLVSLELIGRHLNGHRAHTSMMHTVLAAVAYEFDEIDQAQTHIEQAMHSVQDYGPADAVILAYLTQARLRFAQRDAATGYAILHEGQALGAQRKLNRVVVTLAAEECTWLGREARYDDALAVALRFEMLRADDTAGGAAVSKLLADKASRIALRTRLRDTPARVLAVLAPAIERCTQLGLQHRLSELLGMQAVAHRLDDNMAQATASLDAAMRIAAPRQYLRTFIDEGPELQAVLEALAQAGSAMPETQAFIQQLLQGLRRDAGTDATSPSAASFGELTRREINIIKRLESGMSNKEIAESIFISEGTLRWHLHNIYGKLGAKNRSGALVAARGMGLL